MISKDRYNVAEMFLSYLTYLGNSTKVAIVLGIPREVVEVLAARENWAHKLKVYMSFRHTDALSPTDRALRRVVIDIQARLLLEVLGQVIDYLHRAPDDGTLLARLSPRNAKSNRPQFRSSVLLDLTRALLLVTRILDRSGPNRESEEPVEDSDRLSLSDALQRVLDAADGLPGLDSVAVAKEVLAKWQNKPEDGETGKKVE